MRLLFIVFSEISQSNGISKKIQAQVDGLRNNGIETHLCHYLTIDGIRFWAIDGKPLVKIGRGFRALVRFYTFFGPIYKYILENKYGGVYIRYVHNATCIMNNFLKKLHNKGIKILIEIPTFPYDGEYRMRSVQKFLQTKIEKMSRRKFHNYVDRIITFSSHEFIFNIKTINISNAISLNRIPLKKKKEKSESNEFRFIGVTNLNFWHGYDRFIYGLSEYYKHKPDAEVYFDIVGDGRVISELKELSDKLHIKEYVVFHGLKSGEELDKLFDSADMAVGCLGCHRKRIREVKSLKNVEYAARGIPMIYSEDNTDFDTQGYVMKQLPDESPINIYNILDKYHSLSFTPHEIRNTVSNLDWNIQMSKVADFFSR